MNPLQKTIDHEVSLSGPGLFTGEPATVTFKPAPVGHGIVFIRTDLGRSVRIPAVIKHITKRPRRSTIRSGADAIETVEHCMSALQGLQIDNVEIEISGGELPGVDGSCLPYVKLLQEAGIKDQSAEKQILRISEPIQVSDGISTLVAAPPENDEFQIIFDLDYGQQKPIGRQIFSYVVGDDFASQIAPARTFVLKHEAEALRKSGLGLHLKPGDVLVLDDNGPIDTQYRFADECVRHKVLDVLGDLYLLGCSIRGKIIAFRSGHSLNHMLVRRLKLMLDAQRHRQLSLREPIMDIRKISRILPHRYPMLLVDRVIALDGDERAVGIKNVSYNEPIFQGHYPGMPVMPGVLIVEAMAQLSGLLLSRKLEHSGKLPMLLSMDKVKLRRPVTPGDQLMLEAETIRVKARTGHVRCKAMVGDQLAAEAIIKFMLVDEDAAGGSPGV